MLRAWPDGSPQLLLEHRVTVPRGARREPVLETGEARVAPCSPRISAKVRQRPVGYFFGVVSNGFGDMSSYASQIQPEDRWAVVAYLRTLQWSQKVSLETLPADVRTRIESELAGAQAAEATAGHGEQ